MLGLGQGLSLPIPIAAPHFILLHGITVHSHIFVNKVLNFANTLRDCRERVVVALGWESEGLGFQLWQAHPGNF